MPTLNVFVKDSNGQPVAGARVAIITKNAAIQPATRFTEGDGGANLYYQGPAFNPPLEVDVMVDAAGYNPFCTATAPILFGAVDIDFPVALQSFRKPFVAAPRRYEGQMCGILVAGLPPIPGGGADPDLVVTWLVFLYGVSDRQRIYAQYLAEGFHDFLVSWPDFENAGGSPTGFRDHCQEVIAAGLRPCAFLSAKPTSSADIRDIQATLANIMLVLPLLVGTVPRFCVAWEASLWMSPADLQFLVDNLSPVWLKQPGTFGYIHLQSGYFSYQPNGQDSGYYWQQQVGNPPKLRGILRQRDPNEDQGVKSEYQARIADCLVRFNGADNCPGDSGDGTPFDDVELEITANQVFNQQMPQSAQNSWGDAAIATPPAGRVKVQGSGNGLTV